MKNISKNFRNLLAVIAVVLIFTNFTNDTSAGSDVPQYHITAGDDHFVVYNAVTGQYKILNLHELRKENHIIDIFQQDSGN